MKTMLWALAFIPLTGIAQPGTGKVNKDELLPMDSSVKIGKLANGFTYYIQHNENPKSRVTMYLVNKVGSVLEEDDQQGLAHFMEHMSFNGTAHFPKNALVDYLQKAGVRFGADLNAYTSFDETVYQLPLPSDKPEIVTNGIQIMRDWAQNATLDPSEIDKERGVILEEKRLGKGARERMQRQYFPLIMNGSRYAVRLPIGKEEVLNNFRYEAIRRFYHDWYRPDLQALIVVGDIDVARIERMVKAKFSDLKNPPKERVRTKYTIPLTGKNQFMVVTDKEMTATNAEVIIKHTAEPTRTAADYRRNLIRSLFNSMLQGRFADLGLADDPPFLQGGAYTGEFLGGLSSFSASVTAKPGELETGFKAVWREVERVRRFGFTATELETAKTNYLGGIETTLREKGKTHSDTYISAWQNHFLRGIPFPSMDYAYNLSKKELTGITLQEVNAVIKTQITATDRDIVILAPEKDNATLPTEATFMSWMKAAEQEDLKPYEDVTSTKPLLPSMPQPGSITGQQYDASLGIHTLTLSNGMKVLLKPTDFKNDEICFIGFAPGGTSLYPDADYQSAVSSGMVPSFGLGNYNAAEFNKFTFGKQYGVNAFISERWQTINGLTGTADLEKSLQLVYAYFTAPRKDTAIFEGYIKRSKASLSNRYSNPSNVFSDTINAIVNNYNIRKTAPSLEKIDQISLGRMYEIYKELFADASGFTFVFVGNIDTLAIRPLLEKYLAGLPALYKHEQARDLHIRPPEGVIERTVYKGSEPKASVYLVFNGDYDYSFENNMKMSALKEVLQIRLTERLREEEAGVYSPSVIMSEVKYPAEQYAMTISFGCAPQNVDKLIASTLDEIEKIKRDGPAAVNIDKFKAEEKRGTEMQLKSNHFWLSYIAGRIQNNEELGSVTNYFPLVERLTPDDVKALANRYLTGKNYLKFVLLPEKGAEQ